MQALLKQIDIEMRCLVLHFNVARCQHLLEAERDPMKRRQYRRLLNASQYAEACFLGEHGYPVPPRPSPKYSKDLLVLDEQCTLEASNAASTNVIDLQTAKQLRRPREIRSRGVFKQWPLMSTEEKARWLAMLRRTISHRLTLVLESGQSEQTRHRAR